MIEPRYPVYVVSRGRHENCLTAKFLIKDGTPFTLVIEREEQEAYAKYGRERLQLLPLSNRGLIYARNWVLEDAKAKGAERFWILDDNIHCIKRRFQGKRIPCNSGVALAAVEDFADRYENVAIAGLNYEMFLPNGCPNPPFVRNVHVYSCTLLNLACPIRWRSYLNDDTDLCLQALSLGWCTVLVNAFLIFKVRTMKLKGGNTGIYQGDGRLKMARALERLWPGVVTTTRRFKRPQHHIKDAWSRFTTPLQLKANAPTPDPERYAMKLEQVQPIQSQHLAQWYESLEAR